MKMQVTYKTEGGQIVVTDIRTILPNCGVVAVANATGATVSEMMDSFREIFKLSTKWKGRTSISQLSRMLKLWDRPNKV